MCWLVSVSRDSLFGCSFWRNRLRCTRNASGSVRMSISVLIFLQFVNTFSLKCVLSIMITYVYSFLFDETTSLHVPLHEIVLVVLETRWAMRWKRLGIIKRFKKSKIAVSRNATVEPSRNERKEDRRETEPGLPRPTSRNRGHTNRGERFVRASAVPLEIPLKRNTCRGVAVLRERQGYTELVTVLDSDNRERPDFQGLRSRDLTQLVFGQTQEIFIWRLIPWNGN